MGETAAEGEGCSRTLVMGIGNPLFGDDGVGSCLASALFECHQGLNVEVRETLGLWEMGTLNDWETVIFIDAIGGDAKAGPRLLKIEPERLQEGEAREFLGSLDPHRASPVALAVLSAAIGTSAKSWYLLGVPAKSLEPSRGLSLETLENALRASQLLERLLKRLGCPISLDLRCVEEKLRKLCLDEKFREEDAA
ncbi:MAG: hydrogenase maturation protease [Acidilobaceae archaeon]|nr:hydrogenase maturation protease [Acidilobaceae archaeon]